MKRYDYDDIETPAEADDWLRKVHGQLTYHQDGVNLHVILRPEPDSRERIDLHGSGSFRYDAINQVRKQIWEAWL